MNNNNEVILFVKFNIFVFVEVCKKLYLYIFINLKVKKVFVFGLKKLL